ncbi:hypothetical protein [Pedobacter sp.]|uniref:hypothetical protein n=1 Tax=Pedobacter sp. TaxID=1411316 RepID=UPI003D7F79D0
MENISIIEGYPDYLITRMEERDGNRKNELPDQLGGHLTELVFEDLLIWDVEAVQVSFKEGDVSLHQKIAETAAEWSKYANIQFDFGYDPATEQYRLWVEGDVSHIRVGFKHPGYWSLVGKDSLDPEIVLPGEITLNLQNFDTDLPSNYKTVVLHEFGHALGFHHEHQSPVSNCDFDWETVYDYLAGPPNYWSKEKVDFNLRKMPAGGLTYSPHDKKSIMHYAFPDWMFLSGTSSPCYVEENVDLSEEDKQMAAEAYPFEGEQIEHAKVNKQEKLALLLEHKKLKAPLAHRVKKSILIAGGQLNEDPRYLSEDMELANLLPTAGSFQFLADLLDQLVKQYKKDADVKLSDIENCETVGDCLKLIEDIIPK